MEKMTKSQIKAEIDRLTGELYDLELTENQMDEIENLQEPKKSNINKLEKMLDDALKTLETVGKKAVFKWDTLSGYYKMKLSTVTPKNVKVGYKVSFRLDTQKIEKINKYFYYNNKDKSDFKDIEFKHSQDICTVKSIEKETGIIIAVSDNHGGKWLIYPDDINGTASNKCVLKDGTNIAFLVYAPKTENK